MEKASLALKIVAIGNSRGIRIPKSILVKYGFGDHAILVEHADGALLKSVNDKRLSWRETYAAASAEQSRGASERTNEWSVFEETLDDGLGDLPW
jgi:antitoxin MazE